MKKERFIITKFAENIYRLSMRKKFLLFFSYWKPVTELVNMVEVPLQFESYQQAEDFIKINLVD